MPATRHTADPGDITPGDENPGVLRVVERAVGAVDELVPDENNTANVLRVRTSRLLPWVGILLAVCAVLLVPWTVWLVIDLPSRQLSPNYDIAWAGFDVMLLLALGATATATLRRSRWMPTAAGWAAGLLVTDAWFDTATSTSGELWAAVLMSVLVELPLAALCVWVALHATEVAEQRGRVLLRRLRRHRP